MNIETRIVSGKGSSIVYHLVTEDGREIGLLRKGRNDRFTTCPWQPMTMNNEGIKDASSVSGLMACYGPNGKADAIRALREAA